jgi:hypothetical protein
MRTLFIVTFLLFITLAYSQSSIIGACTGCIVLQQNCVAKCKLTSKTVAHRAPCMKLCISQKGACMKGCMNYTHCKIERESVRRECKQTKAAGILYVKNIKSLYKPLQATRTDAAVAKIVKLQQQHLAQAKSFAAKFWACKKKLQKFNCHRPCVSKRCIRRRKCLLGCKDNFTKCKPVCKVFQGSDKAVACVNKCQNKRTICSKSCRSTCGKGCRYVKNCKINCTTRFKNTLSRDCTKNFVPVCQKNCTPKCNRKCNMRDNEKCLLICAAQCAHGCYSSANRQCIVKSQARLRVCKKKCVYKRVPVASFDQKCGNTCAGVSRGKFGVCNERNKKACPNRCTNLCKRQPCKTVACLATCNKKCNSGCYWLQRKTCHLFTVPKFRQCLRTCSGWNPVAEARMVLIKKREELGTGHTRCHRDCAAKKSFSTVKCFMRQRHKCPMKCKGICKASKCTTDGCRDRCSTKCSNTCYILLKKKCSLLAQDAALTCLKKCP